MNVTELLTFLPTTMLATTLLPDTTMLPTTTMLPDTTFLSTNFMETTYMPESTFMSESSFMTETSFMSETTYMPTTTYLPPTTTAASDVRTWLSDLVLKRSAMQGSFWQGFLASLSVVIVSELGDKTFFIAAIMAMKHPRVIVFAGAISALVFMTILSAAFGWIATVIPRVYTYYISAALFAIFGLKMLRDGWKMDPNEGQEELEEVQTELKRREDQTPPKERSRTSDVDSTSVRSQSPGISEHLQGEAPGPPQEPQPGPSTQSEPLREEKEETMDMLEQGQAENRRRKRNAVLKVLFQAATLTFLAEWGDRSQVATVVLAARENAFGVVVGGSLGHSLCTGLAVVGGRMIAQKISVRTVTIIGGIVFLLFAISALFISPD